MESHNIPDVRDDFTEAEIAALPITTERAAALLAAESDATLEVFLYDLGLHDDCRTPREQQVQRAAECLGWFVTTGEPDLGQTVSGVKDWLAACRNSLDDEGAEKC